MLNKLFKIVKKPTPLFILLSCLSVLSSQLFAESQKKEPLWWTTLKWAITAADQSTAPADDFIPYDWIKNQANELIVKPSQEAVSGPSKPTIRFEQDPKTNVIRRLSREEVMQGVKDLRNQHYVYSQQELQALPQSDVPIGGYDYAAIGGTIKKIKDIKAPRQTFQQAATSVIKKHFDIEQNTGGLKILDAVQAAQHLIDCQAQNKTATDCYKQYGINFAMSKAITEMLSIVGQKAGWYFVKNAVLGEAVLSGATTVGYLAYADYIAIQEIFTLLTIRVEQYGDELQNQRQAENNEASNRDNWDGTYGSLKIRLDTFENQFNQYVKQAGEELFIALGDVKEEFSNLKSVRTNLNQEWEHFTTTADLEKSLKKVCSELVSPDNTERLSSIQTKISDTLTFANQIISKAHPLAKTCSNNKDLESLNAMEKLLKDSIRDLDGLFKEKQTLLQKISIESEKQIKQKKEELIEEAARSPELEQAYRLFEESFSDTLISTWAALVAYDDYKNIKHVYLRRWRGLKGFLEGRAKDILYEKKLEQALSAISKTDSLLKSFKPNRMPYEETGDYNTELNAIASDLQYMDDVGLKLKEKIEARVEELNRVPTTCSNETSTEQEQQSNDIETFKKEADEVFSLIKKCRPITIPKVIGKNVSNAKLALENLGLKVTTEQSKELVTKPKNANLVFFQKPKHPTTVSKGAPINLVHWGPFDREALCNDFKRRLGNFLSNKNIQESKKLLNEMRSFSCPNLDEANNSIQRTEQLIQDEQKIMLPRLIGYDLKKAREILIKRGFKNDGIFDIKPIKTDDPKNSNLVKSQTPHGEAYYSKGTAITLEYWTFDPYLAMENTNCNSITGSYASWNSDVQKTECLCREGTVKLKSKKKGQRCAQCDEVKLYFDKEINKGDRQRAEKVLALGRKGGCSWVSEGESTLNQNQAADNAIVFCKKELPGSVPVKLSDGTYRCNCPADTVHTSPSHNQPLSCIPCNDMAKYFDKATAARNTQDASQILQISRHCSWSTKGSQILANLQQQIAQQQQQQQLAQQQQQQAQQNAQRCSQLHQQVRNACNSRQWRTLPSLYRRINQMPNCQLDSNLFNQCTAMQTGQLNQQLTQIGRPPSHPGSYTKPPPPRRPEPKPTRTSSGSRWKYWTAHMTGSYHSQEIYGFKQCKISWHYQFSSKNVADRDNKLKQMKIKQMNDIRDKNHAIVDSYNYRVLEGPVDSFSKLSKHRYTGDKCTITKNR